MLNLDRWVKDKKSVELTFRLQADKAVTDPAAEFCECYYDVDDVQLFGGSVVVGDFEADGGWTYHEQDWPWSYREGRWPGESRSGKYGCVIGFGSDALISERDESKYPPAKARLATADVPKKLRRVTDPFVSLASVLS